MFVDTQDREPPSLLRPEPPGRATLIGGAVGALSTHVALPVVTFAITGILTALGVMGDPEPSGPERDVVEAELVKLGEPPDPHELPNRDVPVKRTAPQNRPAPTKKPERQQPPPDAGKPPPDTVEGPEASILERAQAFAEIAKKREQEGSPEGVEGGTADEAKEGDIYAGKIQVFFRKGWSVPTVLSDEQVQDLQTVADVQIDEDRGIRGFGIRKESGNALFDQSVRDQLSSLRKSGAKIPEPPSPDVADDYLGRTVGVRFRGRDVR